MSLMANKIDTTDLELACHINNEDGSADIHSMEHYFNSIEKEISSQELYNSISRLENKGFIVSYNDDGSTYYNVTNKFVDIYNSFFS